MSHFDTMQEMETGLERVIRGHSRNGKWVSGMTYRVVVGTGQVQINGCGNDLIRHMFKTTAAHSGLLLDLGCGPSIEYKKGLLLPVYTHKGPL